jgi:tetratricopeptide (TPR) repeat protein
VTEPSLERARQLHARAVDEFGASHPARARALGRRCVALLEGIAPGAARDELLARALVSLSLSAAELGGPGVGVELLERADALAERLALPAITFLVLAQRGALAIRSGDLPAAANAFGRAREYLQHATPFDRTAVLGNSANAHLYLGELRAARPLLEAAIRSSIEADLPLDEAKARHNLGYVEFLDGDLPTALGQMALALTVAADLPRGIPLLDRARVLAEAGLVREADQALAEAAELFGNERLAQDLGETELERARCALIGGDAEGARRFAMRARDRFRRRGNDRWRRSAELVLLQGDLAAGRPGGRLAGPALRLREEFERDGVRLPAQTAALIAAEAHLSAGQPAAARAALAGLARTARHDPITARLHSHYVRARLDADTGRAAAAARRARQALDELAAYQASFGSIDLATAAAVHGRRIAELDLAIALRSGQPEIVLGAAERGRAVATRLPAVRPPDDPVAAELLAELRQTVEALRSVEFDRAQSTPLHKRRQDLEARISARSWTRTGAGVVRQLVTLDELGAALGDATFVSFARSEGGLHAVALESGRARLVALGSADAVDEQVRRVRADLDVLADPRLPTPLRGSVTASLTRSFAELDRLLFAPLRAGGRLVIASTGLLGQLPWGLLPSLRSVPVEVVPSATAWHAARARPPSRHRRVVAIAGPDLGRGIEEATAVGRIWDARLLTGTAATGAAFAQALAGARIAHVAAHGVHQTENPMFSSLRLADGALFAHELDQTARTPEHVVLSACELGLATVRPGDEALGLTSVLLHLGTRCVVAGVARVGDEAAAETMADYHGRLAGGQDSAEALAAALAQRPVPFACFGAAYRAVAH